MNSIFESNLCLSSIVTDTLSTMFGVSLRLYSLLAENDRKRGKGRERESKERGSGKQNFKIPNIFNIGTIFLQPLK